MARTHAAKAKIELGGQKSAAKYPDIRKTPDCLLAVACSKAPPTPEQCLTIIEEYFRDRCVVLDSARSSAAKVEGFQVGHQLLTMLRKLATKYRDALLDGGDYAARDVFGSSKYAAKESATVMKSPKLKRLRTFIYEGKPVVMQRHLKIGVKDSTTETIRVHFHWDAAKRLIVIGYCGEHLPVFSH